MRHHQDNGYVHGYGAAEQARLHDQAATLEALLHHDSLFPDGSTVLEAGSGVGAQTIPLLRRNPGARLTCLDIAEASLAAARARITAAGLPPPDFWQGDLRALPFADATFDHAFVCFVLEHLPEPAAALAELRRVLRPGGSLTVIEGGHGSVLLHPEDPGARAVIACQVALQRAAGGDAEIGRRLGPLLGQAGFAAVRVSPRPVAVDGSRPALAEGFVRRTFAAMVAGIRDEAIRAGLTDAAAFDAGLRALLRTAEPDGTFCYTFFKAVAIVPAA
ncbi:methyltransferase domain-containing protein [Methylobacterium nonmethylotrophicum]|uniref:Methyltransferase domain-containing protein n=1 Tax=Methylobacterium nonmethylotrophicum TaxID=1141884 RepID=A0A4Z0NFD7_9HYPH|nr:methyltransferase domain-containing protein [Methylobacterium nonmethylotrophicum]TGD93176.1 methyltransferase domain-containing protein [Methylobacterium nonmethylotrophicum]